MTNINSESQSQAQHALDAVNNLLADLNTGQALGADNTAAIVAATSSQVVLLGSLAAAVPFGFGAYAAAGGEAQTVVQADNSSASSVFGQPGAVRAGGTASVYDPSGLGTGSP